MPILHAHARLVARVAAALAVAVALLASQLTAASSGDLQGQIATGQSAAAALRATIAADSAEIRLTAGGLQSAESRLSRLQIELQARQQELRRVQNALLIARNHLVDLENRLHRAAQALSANLVARYENDPPSLMTVILQAHGFTQLLEQVSFLQKIGHQDGQVIEITRAARAAVRREVTHLASLESRDRTLTNQVLSQRNQVAALQAALLARQIAQIHARSRNAAKLSSLNAHLQKLEAKAAAEAARAAAAARALDAAGTRVGGIAVDTGGMVQAPAGAPAAVAQVIAAGNAIATMPYIYGGGHGSFHADGYDCSGSVSYALAAAGLISSPMVSGDFESYGDPGPGRWITIYANAGHVWMQVAGWRFDTVAQAVSGTRWAQGGGEYAGFVVRHPPGL
jgi:peptidoglycan hydrolase CwlO-like protein